MSKKNPIIAVTGSSGAGTTTVKVAMQQIYRRNGYKAVVIEGDSFHKYDRKGMLEALKKAADEGKNLSHFGPEGNDFRMLADFFKQYKETLEKFNSKFPDVDLKDTVFHIDRLSSYIKNNINVNLLTANIIFELSTLTTKPAVKA